MKAHPLAELIPTMLTDELAELERDIQAHGQRQPITIYEGMILDGRHRYAICQKLEIEPKVETFTGTEAEAKALVLSLNVHRRHLTLEQKHQIIAAELERDPTQSDRAIAEKAKVSPTTVGKVRTVHSGQSPEKRVGRDGKARKPAGRGAERASRAAGRRLVPWVQKFYKDAIGPRGATVALNGLSKDERDSLERQLPKIRDYLILLCDILRERAERRSEAQAPDMAASEVVDHAEPAQAATSANLQ